MTKLEKMINAGTTIKPNPPRHIYCQTVYKNREPRIYIVRQTFTIKEALELRDWLNIVLEDTPKLPEGEDAP